MIGRLDTWLLAAAPAERLAVLRVLIGAYAVGYLVINFGEFDRLAGRSSAGFEPVGIVGLLDAPLGATGVWTAYGLLLASGAAFVAGWRFRVSGPLFALSMLGWASYHSSWGQLLHFEHLITLHLLVLAVAPAADVYALDAQRAERAAEPHTRYGWPIRLLAIATAATYVLSGISKLRLTGAAWFDPDTLANHIGYSATRSVSIGGADPPLAAWVLGQRWVLAPMAIGALVVELGAPLALVGRRLRNAWVVAALGFHGATAATMLVFFGYRGLGFAFLPLFAVERMRRGRSETVNPVSPCWQSGCSAEATPDAPRRSGPRGAWR